MLADRFRDLFKPIRTSAFGTLLGVSAGSHSHFQTGVPDAATRGFVFRNDPNVSSFVDTVEAGRVPIATGIAIDDEELLATSFATGLRNGRVESALIRSIRRTRPELSMYYEQLEGRLREAGVLESYTDDDGQDGVRLTELGHLFEDETLSLFQSVSA